MWTMPDKYESNGFYSFVNRDSGRCLDVNGRDGKGNVLVWGCENMADQRWKFEGPEDISVPEASWEKLTCHSGGDLSVAVTVGRSDTTSLSLE